MEKLYNNIIMPETREIVDAQSVPYLKNPPEVIDISVGRQLFVDDFLIEETDLTAEYHKAKNLRVIPYCTPKLRGKPMVRLLRAQKAAVCGLMRKTKNLKCGMKPHGSKICAMTNQLTV